MLFSKKTIPHKNLMLFTRQLATLIHAGIPLLRSLLILEQQEGNTLLKKTLLIISEALQEGNSFSDALGAHPLIFNKIYRSMVKAGEFGSVLGNVLMQIATLQERTEKMRSKTISVLIYPTLVLLMTFLIFALLLVFIVPKFEAVFSELLHGKPLPVLTHVILDISRMMMDHVVALLMTLFILVTGLTLWGKTTAGTYWRDRFFIALPLTGTLVQKAGIARWARTLGTLLSQEVPILQALTIAQETTGNRLLRRAVGNIHDSIELGNSMTGAMQQQRTFPPMVMSMIDVGEETAQLPEMLLNIATIYDDEFQTSMEQLLALLEPVMILILALVVGTIVIALFLPLVTMMGEMGN